MVCIFGLAGKVEDEVAHLEVYVYEDEADNIYVHHDIMLPAIPLCLEWLDLPVGRSSEGRTTGNFVAVGTMDPDIEIWDLVTGSTDKQVKLWNVQDNKPSMVVSRKLDVGKVFSTTFAPDPEVSFRLAVAGSKGVVQVWDTSTNAAVRRTFAGRLPATAAGEGGEVQERTVGVAEDDSDSSDDEEEEGEGEGEQGEDGADGERDGWESMDED
ncbi:hypothetical protein VTN96DRAFT_7156 [Rasamsonia emersonii]